ncbi:glycosyltransferase family 61 protein [Pseudoprimorskyibacter insulae]|uniref:Glycosyltransferase 61 catalytic domain-containing protein n=1 Tax=Pseudoprimorskyibacter insulae TaxID=1695997 RepID=A0A2R8AZL8_9RHOB|nr:glycosyltransferase family 61 protein [Pseudoprimorskyibacter insulae]SPF81279.1 hypothetical protein PRI8871_03101 [Pseudoprimorskyibacter insulae]
MTVDPTLQPKPEDSWSEDLLTVDNALMATPKGKLTLSFKAGIFDADGNPVHQASVWRGNRRIMLPPRRLPDPKRTMDGAWLWGGLLYNHFGHFLCEGTTRLWALDHLPQPVNGLLFYAKYEGEEGEAVRGYHERFIRLMGCDLPITIVRQPTRVDRLFVPGQGFGLGPMSPGSPKFRAAVAARFGRDVAAEGPKKIYVSRSEIGPRKGGLLFEKQLEELLVQQGYEIFHPQKHSLDEQVARYKAATHILAAEGSALHFLAFCARADQNIGMVVRRVSGATRNIQRNVGGFCGKTPSVFKAIKRSWMPETSTRKHMAVAELDFPQLQRELQQAGFISDGPAWRDFTGDEAAKEIFSVRFRRINKYHATEVEDEDA